MLNYSTSIALTEDNKSNVYESEYNSGNQYSIIDFESKLDASMQTEQILLKNHGYEKDNDIPVSYTLQGELFVATNKNDNDQPVIIKKIASIDSDGFYYVFNEKLIRQSVAQNSSYSANIATYIDCFQSATHSYLVIEYNFGASLKEFVQQSHEYIEAKKLNMKEYHIKIRDILWKLIKTIHMLHNNCNDFALDLCPENIFLTNSDFILNEDGTVTVNPDIEIKFIDFPPVRYTSDPYVSTYIKKYMNNMDNIKPNFDGRSSDMFSFGVILYFCSFGSYPFQNKSDEYSNNKKYTLSWAICNGKLNCYLAMNSLLGNVSKYCLKLLNGLLNIEHHKRLTTNQVLNHKWFNTYRSLSLV